MAYQQRIIVYLDILGFKSLVARSETDGFAFASIVNITENLGMWIKDKRVIEDRRDSTFRIQSFSDCTVLSLVVDNERFWKAVRISNSIIMMLWKQGAFCRGALTIGALEHDIQRVYGPALIQAYDLERNIAKFPRLMLSKQARSFIQKMKESDSSYEEDISRFLKRDDDGVIYINNFAKIRETLIGGDDDAKNLASAEANVLREYIVDHLENDVDDPRTFQKFEWMAQQFNQFVADTERFFPQLKQIERPALSQ